MTKCSKLSIYKREGISRIINTLFHSHYLFPERRKEGYKFLVTKNQSYKYSCLFWEFHSCHVLMSITINGTYISYYTYINNFDIKQSSLYTHTIIWNSLPYDHLQIVSLEDFFFSELNIDNGWNQYIYKGGTD